MSAKFLDLVSPEQKRQIKKASSQRLFKWLVDSGMSENDAEKLSREQLMEAWAEALYTGKEGLTIYRIGCIGDASDARSKLGFGSVFIIYYRQVQ